MALLTTCVAAILAFLGSQTSSPVLTTKEGYLASPGRLRITHARIDNAKQVQAALAEYGLTECGGTGTREDQAGHVIERFTDCRVALGHELFWIDVLSHSPAIARADLEPTLWASASNETGRLYFRPQSPSGTAPFGRAGGTPSQQLVQYLEARFAQPARTTVLRRTERFVEVEVKALRGVVVRNQNYWETLTIRAAFVGGASDQRAFIVVDGRYANGVGSREPANERYEDMTGKYDADLRTYVGGLTNAITTRFGG